jgi:hypothetical protein
MHREPTSRPTLLREETPLLDLARSTVTGGIMRFVKNDGLRTLRRGLAGLGLLALTAGGASAQMVFDGNVLFNNNATGTLAGQFVGAAGAGAPSCAAGTTAATLGTGGSDLGLFTRADNGLAAQFHPMDRFIKNTSEILSPLNELTARMQMTRHEFLTPDRIVQRTVFGTGKQQVTTIVNLGTADYVCSSKLAGEVTLPAFGFLVESPIFVAFHARNWNGQQYAAPPVFTLRSLDARPLSSSRKVRVFHAFGDDKLHLGAGTITGGVTPGGYWITALSAV